MEWYIQSIVVHHHQQDVINCAKQILNNDTVRYRVKTWIVLEGLASSPSPSLSLTTGQRELQ